MAGQKDPVYMIFSIECNPYSFNQSTFISSAVRTLEVVCLVFFSFTMSQSACSQIVLHLKYFSFLDLLPALLSFGSLLGKLILL